jgi:chaperonin GroEL
MDREKAIFFDKDARALLLDGMRIAYKSLETLDSSDPILDTGLSFIRQIVQKMNHEHNDGAQIAAKLLYKLTEHPFEEDPSQLISYLEKQITYLKEDELVNYLILTKGFPSDVVDSVLDTINLAGKHGILIDESLNSDTIIKKTAGIQFETTSTHPQLEGSLANAKILILEKKMSASLDILPILEEFTKSGDPLFIIGEEITGDALSSLLFHKLEKKITVIASKMPGFGEARKKHLDEIYHITGATSSALGKASFVSVDNQTITIIEGDKSPIFSIQIPPHADKKIYQECLSKAKSVLKHGVFVDLIASLQAIHPFHTLEKIPTIDAYVALSALKHAIALSASINRTGALIVESRR